MKKAFLTIIAASLVLTSCADKTSKTEEAATTGSTELETPKAEEAAKASITGTWKFSDIDMEIPKGKEKMLEEMKAKMKAETSFTFNQDGTMSADNPAVKGKKGTYVHEGSNLIITDDKSKKADTLAIGELTNDKLVITSGKNERKATMTFTK